VNDILPGKAAQQWYQPDLLLATLPQVLKDILEQQWREHIESYPECPFVFHENGRKMKSFYKT